MNTIIILGNITKDIELKYLPSGSAIANFSIAYNESYKDSSGTKKESTSFFDVSAFGKRAEVINQYFKKGKPILIRGTLKQDSWTTNDGQKRSKVFIVLDDFDFLPCKGEGRDNGQQPSRQQQAAPQQQSAPSDIDDDEIPF
ncbi:single-stranded DNA-binding protein [Hydrogenimonas sp.]